MKRMNSEELRNGRKQNLLLKMALILFAIFIFLMVKPEDAYAYQTRVRVVKEFTFKDRSGKTRSSRDFSTKSTVLIFGRSSCSISRKMLSTASSASKASGVSSTVVFLGVDNYDSGISSLARTYPNVIFSPASSLNNASMWSGLRACGLNRSSITLPAVFILDQYHNIAYYSTGSQTGSLASNMRSSLLTQKMALNSSDFSLTLDQEAIPYTGKAVKPTVTLSFSKTYSTLKKNRDYTVSYKNNKKVGTATVTVKGKGGFSGKLTKKFKIVKNGMKKGKTFAVDGLQYKVTTGGKSGKIKVSFVKLTTSATYIFIPDTVTYNGQKCIVTSIAANACKGNTKLISINIGGNVTSIGKNAFQNCTSVKYLALYMTKSCSIGSKAFSGLSSLQYTYITDKKLSDGKIKKDAFSGTPDNLTVYIIDGYLSKYEKMLKKKGISSKASFYSYKVKYA